MGFSPLPQGNLACLNEASAKLVSASSIRIVQGGVNNPIPHLLADIPSACVSTLRRKRSWNVT